MSAGLVDGLLADRYLLSERIATGGMGEVWRAQDTLLDRPVAVKTLRAEFVEDEEFRARFRAEARHAARLSHAGIASVYDFGELPDRAWLVMELVDGEALSGLLRRGPLSPDRTLDVVAQTAAALQVAHDAGVVHRDVKPGNLLVRPDGVVKVTDFGIASATDAVPLTRTGQLVGTAFYVSPEQAGGRPATSASDLYALGVVAYECLAGRRPFDADTPVAVVLGHLQTPPPPLPDAVPEGVRALVGRLLAKDPADRPASAAAVASEATALRAGSGDLATLPVLPPEATRPEGAQELTRTLTAAMPVAGVAGADATSVAAAPAARPAPRIRTTAPSGPTSHRTQRLATRAALVLLAVLALGFGLRSAFTAAPTADPSVAVPAVATGTSDDAARAALTAAGLGATVESATSPSVPAGTVIATRPGAGAEVDPGAEVVLVVSSGKPPVRVDASSLVGTRATSARDLLASRGLVPRLVADGRGTPVGTVSSVEPVGDVAVGTTVVLHVVPAPAPPPPAAEDADEADDEGAKGKGKGGKD